MAEQKHGIRTAESVHLDPQEGYTEKADQERNKSFETLKPTPSGHSANKATPISFPNSSTNTGD